MIYFQRFLWLAAWSIWVWLGFGLYRELPRDLGPAVCEIPLTKGWRVIGFLADRHAIVARDLTPPTEPPRCAVYDAWTGERIRDFDDCSDLTLLASSRYELLLKRRCLLQDDWVNPSNIPWEWRTVAIRNWYGRVVEREWQLQWKDHESADGALVADNEGTVYKRAAVNYPLFLLCQSTLALPLILLWAMSRWQRKRKLRAAAS